MGVHCDKALEVLWPLIDPSGLDSSELAAAREHLQRCTACQAYFRRDATLGKRLRDLRTSGLIALPEACRKQLRMQLMGEETDAGSPGTADSFVTAGSDSDVQPIRSVQRKRRRSWTEGIAAAAAIALLAGGLLISRGIEAPLSDRAFASDFMHAALPEIVSGNVTATQVTAFYAEQFGEEMDPARLLDARVTRVAVCEFGGRRGAMVEYELGGERLVHYQIPVEGGRTAGDVSTGREGDLNVARWADDRSEHALVSALPIENLEEFVRASRDRTTADP